jgi:hypothetical protein
MSNCSGKRALTQERPYMICTTAAIFRHSRFSLRKSAIYSFLRFDMPLFCAFRGFCNVQFILIFTIILQKCNDPQSAPDIALVIF